jgi:hypothetical protein
MTVRVERLLGAANNPDDGGQPTMLSVGDSVMWGQGLRPEDKSRELVRQRKSRDDSSEAVELSMARSGAHLTPQFAETEGGRNPVKADDAAIEQTFKEDDDIPGHYDPDNFAREVPNPTPTTIQQLELAETVLADDRDTDPADIELILLNGGANDVGIDGFLLPIAAYQEAGFARGWAAWLMDQAREVETEMRRTLDTALALFPKAVIVVTGYYPVFSYESVFKAQLLGLLYRDLNVAVPVLIDMLTAGSEAWQAASNRHIKRAVAAAGGGDRTVTFVRSDIEGTHTMFAPSPWLWEPDLVAEGDPSGDGLAWVVAPDDVQTERREQCDDGAFFCQLASIGHPNVAGARDYADAIERALEAESVFSPSGHRCERAADRNYGRCDRLSDDGTYRCIQADAAVGDVCGAAVSDLNAAAGDQFDRAGDRMDAAGDDLDQAGDCYDDLDEATDECESERERAIDECEREHGQAIDECERRYRRRRDDCNDIQCTSYTNCDRFKWYDPRRGVCKAAREACKASASVRREACKAAATVEREGCKAAATARREACKAAATATDATCRVGAAAERTACAAREVGEAAVNAAVGVAHGAAGVALGTAGVVTSTGCAAVRWGLNRGCRLVNAGVKGLCDGVAAAATGACWVGAAAEEIAESFSDVEYGRERAFERERREPVVADDGPPSGRGNGPPTDAGRADATDGERAEPADDGVCYRCVAGGLLTLGLVAAAAVALARHAVRRR